MSKNDQLLTQMSPELRTAFKNACHRNGTSMKDMIQRFAESYVRLFGDAAFATEFDPVLAVFRDFESRISNRKEQCNESA
jgi:hypothetical protein